MCPASFESTFELSFELIVSFNGTIPSVQASASVLSTVASLFIRHSLIARRVETDHAPGEIVLVAFGAHLGVSVSEWASERASG